MYFSCFEKSMAIPVELNAAYVFSGVKASSEFSDFVDSEKLKSRRHLE